MQDSPILTNLSKNVVVDSVKVEEERENLSVVKHGVDGPRSSGRCIANSLQQMSEEEQLSKMSKENQKAYFKRRSSALHLSSVVEGIVASSLFPLNETNECCEPRPKQMKRSERLSVETLTGIEGFPSLSDKSRHFMFEVVSVDSDIFLPKIVIKNMKTHQFYDLKLEGSIWSFTKLTVKNKIKIIDPEFESHNVIKITDEKGLIIVEPTTLVSSTTLSQGFWCKRKVVLSEKFKSSDTNISMMLGIVCHELFQIALSRRPKFITSAWLMMQFRNTISSRLTIDFIALGLSVAEFETQLKPYLSNIAEWMKSHMVSPMGVNKRLIGGDVIGDIEDMEINMWSDVIGVKGRIDVAFRRKGDGRIVPLELKTGKSNYSSDHEAQVLLYCLLMSERDSGQIPPGMLLYLKDATSQLVKPNIYNLKHILAARNGMAIFGGHSGIDAFPDPLEETRLCSKCQFAPHCTLTQKFGSKNENVSEEMEKFVQQRVSYLTDDEIAYGKKWLKWLFAEWEVNKERKNMDGIFTIAANEREQKGVAISGLFLVKTEVKKDEFWLKFEKPDSSLLPLNILELGEFAIISTDDFVAVEMGAVIDRQNNSVSIKCKKSLTKALTKSGTLFHLDRYETNSSFPMLLNGVINFLDNNTEAKKLRNIIIDKKQPTTTTIQLSVIEKIKPMISHLSKNQIRAVIKSLMVDDYLLIQGFPGSGKTSTIVGIVKCLVDLGKSVLLTAYTNTAVDNMLLKLKEVLPEEKLLRIGGNQATFRMDEIKPLLLDEKISIIENKKELLNEARSMLMKVPVIGTTCLTAGNHQFFKWRSTFDYCIVDEAALATQAAVLKPLMMGTKFILVGDCRQLEPLVLSTSAKDEGMAISLMEELTPIAEKADTLICLNEQYRMNSTICELSSSLFYDGKLKCANEEIANRTIQINTIDKTAEEFDPKLAKVILSDKKEDSILFIDTQSRTTNGNMYLQYAAVTASKFNKGESQLIKNICQLFISANVSENSIGVMSTYRNQVDELCKTLPKSIETNTVDQFQGRDKDVILLSLVHTSSISENYVNESHLSEKRLNVALTRAKKKLILVGCRDSLSSFPLMKRVIEKIGYVFQLKSRPLIV